MSHLLIDEFVRSDSSDMVAAALYILAKLADDAEKRHRVVAPWAWDLRLRARQLEKAGRAAAAAQARVIARMVGAVALGQLSGAELRASQMTDGVWGENDRIVWGTPHPGHRPRGFGENIRTDGHGRNASFLHMNTIVHTARATRSSTANSHDRIVTRPG